MSTNNKTVLLIGPSLLVAKGIEGIFSDLGEFEVIGILSDFSRTSEVRLRNMDPDLILIDPIVFDFASRADGRNTISQYTNAAVVAIPSTQIDEESLKQYDDVISIYDEPATIIRKLRIAVDSKGEETKPADKELSSREKEILICVAKGMLNKEIADKFSISIYTVITHRKNITRKTGIKTVAGLTVYALLNNLIDINEFE